MIFLVLNLLLELADEDFKLFLYLKIGSLECLYYNYLTFDSVIKLK
jgi:hypothetical protein